MSLTAPVAPPDSGGGEAVPPPSPPAPSPENADLSSPPALAVTLPLPSLPPLASSPLPIVIVGATPPSSSPSSSTPIPTPPSLPSPSPASSQPQPQPQPPLASTPPITKDNPPQGKQNPPRVSPPVNIKPISTTPPTTATTPPPSSKTSPTTSPATPSTPSLQQPPQRSTFRQPKTGPDTQQSPSRPGPTRPKTTPTAAQPQHSPLPTSATLPSPPPVALLVPQAPEGGAWMPFMAGPPTPLPTFPGPPGVITSPAAPLVGSTNGGSSSALAPSGADHQNIEAAGSGSSNGNGSSGFIVGLCVGGVLLVLLGVVVAILVVFCRRRMKKFGDHKPGSKHGAVFTGFEEKTSLPQYTKPGSTTHLHQVLVNVAAPPGPTTPTSGPTLSSGTFTYDELAGATSSFSEHNLLGQGGFGYVFKGVLPNGKEVAVKQLKIGGHQGEREFKAEVETISQVHHKHLVSLVGYCIAGAERLLVYEFVPNNTLEFHLHGEGQPVMDWATRLKIAIGSAKGLAYLHEDCSPTIIHRDIKAANILVDFNFEAKVSDFGLAKIFSNTNSSVTHVTTRVVGTFGYLAPEYASSGKVTDKSDVYSYGVMLLELITGRPPICNFGSASNGSLVNWARPLLTQAIGDGNFDTLADPRLQNNYNVDEMASMVACAAACVRVSAWRRPRMSQVVRALEGNLSPSELDDGTRPGHSSMHFPYESLDFDARNYIEDLKRMALTGNNVGYTTSRYSENTSEYGLNPSASTTDTSQRS